MVNLEQKKSLNSSELESYDTEIFDAIQKELKREQAQIELIASENIVSRAVLEAQGSILTNKYAEGYPDKRYYGGCEFVDVVEKLAIERACKLFGANFANVQPHSGSQANQAVYLALLSPGDKVLGMSLAAGGHLTHGSKVNLSGKWFDVASYGVDPNTYLIDYDEVRKQALSHKPKLIIAGGSAYPRFIDFKKFRAIADEVGAYLMVDMAHFAGLVAAGVFPNPMHDAHVVTTTTHKVLRGPRGGMILTNDADLAKKINSAVFPGIQGGPLMHVIAAKAVSFAEALSAEYKTYGKQVIENCKIMADTLVEQGLAIITGGTDCHLCLVDLRPYNVTGAEAERSLENAGLTCNKNAIPFDPLPPAATSGIRLGSPAGTTRGFGTAEFKEIGLLIAEVLRGLRDNGMDKNRDVEGKVRAKVDVLCKKFPIYEWL